MDISPSAQVTIGQGYVYYLPKKMPPDKLTEQWLYQRGEFSIHAEIAYEKHLNFLWTQWRKRHGLI